MNTVVGFGGENFSIAVYIANRPEFGYYRELANLQPIARGEIQHIVAHTSNHWRKIFNVYGKFIEALKTTEHGGSPDWRKYRDEHLLQAHSDEALLFSPPDFSAAQVLHIIAGKTYATQLQLTTVIWLDGYFAVDPARHLIVCPYLDYRQLSDQRIERLVELVREIDDQGVVKSLQKK